MNRNYGCCFSEFGYCPDLTAQEDTSHTNSGPRSSLLDTSDIDLGHDKGTVIVNWFKPTTGGQPVTVNTLEGLCERNLTPYDVQRDNCFDFCQRIVTSLGATEVEQKKIKKANE